MYKILRYIGSLFGMCFSLLRSMGYGLIGTLRISNPFLEQLYIHIPSLIAVLGFIGIILGKLFQSFLGSLYIFLL